MKLNIKVLILILGLTLISIVFVSKSIQQKIYNLSAPDKLVLTLISVLGLILGSVLTIAIVYINFDSLKLILRGLRAPP